MLTGMLPTEDSWWLDSPAQAPAHSPILPPPPALAAAPKAPPDLAATQAALGHYAEPAPAPAAKAPASTWWTPEYTAIQGLGNDAQSMVNECSQQLERARGVRRDIGLDQPKDSGEAAQRFFSPGMGRPGGLTRAQEGQLKHLFMSARSFRETVPSLPGLNVRFKILNPKAMGANGAVTMNRGAEEALDRGEGQIDHEKINGKLKAGPIEVGGEMDQTRSQTRAHNRKYIEGESVQHNTELIEAQILAEVEDTETGAVACVTSTQTIQIRRVLLGPAGIVPPAPPAR